MGSSPIGFEMTVSANDQTPVIVAELVLVVPVAVPVRVAPSGIGSTSADSAA
jgi:hypothetical protein